MVQIIRNASSAIGYEDLIKLVRETAWLSSTFALASFAIKFFSSNVQLKSHFVFGQVTAVTVNLLFFNKYLRETNDPQKNDVLYVVYFLMLCAIPLAIGRMVTNLCFEKITWIQTGIRGLSLVGAGLITLYAFQLYERKKKKQVS